MKAGYLYIIFFVICLIIGAGCIGDVAENKHHDTSLDDWGKTGNEKINSQNDTIYQFSTINALLEGVYDGEITFGELREKGDFGLGTFNSLDGEMIELDGTFYQVKADGNAYKVNNNATSPFAAITFFETDIEKNITDKADSQQIADDIEELLPSKNLMYAVKITGNFSYMKTRSVAAQEKPYPRLVDVTKDQSVFQFNNTKGTIVGYWMPEYANGINVPGFHLHFITEDRTAGGHVLEYTVDSGTIELDTSNGLMLDLPSNENYLAMDLSSDTEGELLEAEN